MKVFVVMLIGSGLELIGVSLMYPFLQAILEPNVLKENKYQDIKQILTQHLCTFQ